MDKTGNLIVVITDRASLFGQREVFLASDDSGLLEQAIAAAEEKYGHLGAPHKVMSSDGVTAYQMVQLTSTPLPNVTLDHVASRLPHVETFYCEYDFHKVRGKVRDVLDMRQGIVPRPTLLGGLVQRAVDHEPSLGAHTLRLSLEKLRERGRDGEEEQPEVQAR